MAEFIDRLKNAYELLKKKGLVHKQKDLANALGMKESHLSLAFKGDNSRLTIGLMQRIAETFPTEINKDYMLKGLGRLEKRQGKPHIPLNVSAGGLEIALGSATLDDCEIIKDIEILGDYDFTITATGDSMEPEIHDGDTLACRLVDLHEIRPDKFYVLDTDEGAVVKMVSIKGDCITCHSVNPRYQDFTFTGNSNTRIYVVVGIVRVL